MAFNKVYGPYDYRVRVAVTIGYGIWPFRVIVEVGFFLGLSELWLQLEMVFGTNSMVHLVFKAVSFAFCVNDSLELCCWYGIELESGS